MILSNFSLHSNDNLHIYSSFSVKWHDRSDIKSSFVGYNQLQIGAMSVHACTFAVEFPV